jgi:hypothetical protein
MKHTTGPSGISSGIIDPEPSPDHETSHEINMQAVGFDLDPMPGAPKPDTTDWPTVSTYAPTDLSSSSDGTPIPDDPAPAVVPSRVGSDVHVRDASPPRKRKTAARGTALATASFRNGTSIPVLGVSPTSRITVQVGALVDEDSGVPQYHFVAEPCPTGRHHHRAPTTDNGVTARFSTQFVKRTDPMFVGTLEGAHWRIAFDDLPPGRWWLSANGGPEYRFSVPKPKQ